MPVSKNKRSTGRVATRRERMWLASREYKALCAKVYLLEQQLETVRAFLSGMIQSMQQTPLPAETPATVEVVQESTAFIKDEQPQMLFTEVQDPTTWDGPPMPVTVGP